MASREETECAAALRFVRSNDGKILLGWMRRVSDMEDTPSGPDVSDHHLRHMAGRQWLVKTLMNNSRKAEG